MPSQLQNILTFTDVAPGATVVQPHRLNINDVGQTPDLGWLNSAVFAPFADAINVTVTNTSQVVASVDVMVTVIYSSARMFGGAFITDLFPHPYWQIGFGVDGTASSIVPSRPTLIFQPGGSLAGPGTFNTWDGVMAQLAAYRSTANGGGEYTIECDNTFVTPGPMIIPANATPYDLTSVTLKGGRHQFVQLGPSLNWVQIADGAHFSHLRSIASLRLENLNETSPADSTFGYILDDLVEIDLGSTVYSTGAAPLWSAVPAGAGSVMAVMVKFSDVGTAGSGYVFDIPNPGAYLVNVPAYAATTGEFFASGVAGAVLLLTKSSSSGALAASYPGFLGTIALNDQWAVAGLRPVPFNAPPLTGSQPAVIGSSMRFDASGGAIGQTLPALSSIVTTPFQIGGMIAFCELSGTGGPLTLTPDVGDTIQGGLYATVDVPLGGSVLLSNDGTSDWEILSLFDPRTSPNMVRLSIQPSDPATDPTGLLLYTKLDTGLTQLFTRISDGTVYQLTPPSSGGGGQLGALFYGMTAGTGNGGPDDYAATVAVDTAIPFPRVGPASAASGIVPAGLNQFTLPVTGLYEISWSIGFLEASQLLIKLGATEVPHTLTTSGAGTQQNVNTTIISASAGDLLSLCNASGNAAALTVQTASGSLTHAQAPTLVIERIES